jgi:hypothetical protein
MINKYFNKSVLNYTLFTGTLFSFLFWEITSVLIPTQVYINNFFKFSLILFLPLCLIKLKNNKLLIIFSIIFFLQEILLKYYYLEGYYNARHYISIFFFLSFIIVLKKFHRKIFFFTSKIINYFILFFIFSTLFFLLKKNIFIYNPESCSLLFINFKFLFSENAHIAFFLPAVLFYSLWRITNIFNWFKFLILISAFLLSILYLSVTMIFGVFIANIIIFLSSYRVLNMKFKIFSLLITFIFMLIFINKPICNVRIVHLLEGIKLIKITNFSSSNSNTESFIPNSYDTNINLTSKVYLDSIITASKTIYLYPFGSGFNNFQILNEKFMLRKIDRDINPFSGRSVLLKMITEFGIFSLIFFIMLIIITFSGKINNEKKIFLLPIILIQLVSGEGYFNGFFLISLLILYFSHGDKNFL